MKSLEKERNANPSTKKTTVVTFNTLLLLYLNAYTYTSQKRPANGRIVVKQRKSGLCVTVNTNSPCKEQRDVAFSSLWIRSFYKQPTLVSIPHGK